jgi:hypothetical protein
LLQHQARKGAAALFPEAAEHHKYNVTDVAVAVAIQDLTLLAATMGKLKKTLKPLGRQQTFQWERLLRSSSIFPHCVVALALSSI